jgi:ABC-type glycerol-3-phosphate transport system substrate-binding protein
MLTLGGVVIFAMSGGLNGSGGTGPVTIWGTTDDDTMQSLLATMRQADKTTFDKVQYIRKDKATYTNDLINAMASGNGPDLFMVTQDMVTQFSDKITIIPYSSVTQASYLNAYIDEGQLFLTPQGTLALPLSVDPLVMYWNRDMFSTAGIAKPPVTWNDFLDQAPRITVLDTGNNVKKSAVALGEWSNIRYAKDIVATLFMQAGDPIVSRDASTGKPMPVLGTTPQGASENPAASALQFYTEFANPTKTIYSWNRALPESQNKFVTGDLAVYFGRASDYAVIAERNPNLRFSVALLPQIKGNSTQMTFGQLTGLSISRVSPNPNGALAVAQKLTSQAAISTLAGLAPLPPVRRDVEVDTSTNAAAAVFIQSALIARGWLDPDAAATDKAFGDMIQSVVSGKEVPSTAVFNTSQILGTLLHTNTIQN